MSPTDSDSDLIWFDETQLQLRIPTSFEDAMIIARECCERRRYKVVESATGVRKALLKGWFQQRLITAWVQGAPQLIELQIQGRDDGATQCELRFRTTRFILASYSGIICLGAAAFLLGLFLWIYFATHGAPGWVSNFLGILTMTLGPGIILLAALGGHSRFQQEFAEELLHHAKRRASSASRGSAAKPILMHEGRLSLNGFLVFSGLMLFSVVGGGFFLNAYIPKPFNLLIFFGLMPLYYFSQSMAGLLIWRRTLRQRLALSGQGIGVALALSTYFFSYIIALALIARAINVPSSHIDIHIVGGQVVAGLVFSFLLASLAVRSSMDVKESLDQAENNMTSADFMASMADSAEDSLFRYWVMSIWLIFVVVNLAGVLMSAWIVADVFRLTSPYHSGLLAEFLRRSMSLSAERSFLLARILLVAYVMPMAAVVGLAVRKIIRRRRQRGILLRISSRAPGSLEESVGRIASFGGISAPEVLVIDTPGIDAYISTDQKICVTTASLSSEVLSESELEALLAHEIGHFKKSHVAQTAWMCWLSEWTLFGYGFLSVVQDSFRMEFEADDFAVQWCRNRNIPVQSVEGMLDKVEASVSILESHRYHAIGSLCIARSRKGPSIKGQSPLPAPILDPQLRSLSLKAGVAQLRGEIRSWKRAWHLFRDYFFGGEMLSYFHPTFEERRRRIRGGGDDDLTGIR